MIRPPAGINLSRRISAAGMKWVIGACILTSPNRTLLWNKLQVESAIQMPLLLGGTYRS
jgi:hypothetical protein